MQKTRSRQDVLNNVSVDIGETKIPTGIAVGQVFVIEAHEMKDGGVEIVDVDFVLHGSETKFVGCTVCHTAFDPSSRKPD